jgi:acyl-coenzyme A thioesterase PaaI-like protein
MSDARRDAGAVVGLLDRAMREAARDRAGGGDVAAVDIHVAFLRDDGGPVTAAARVCGGGKSVSFCEAEITDAAGHVVARAMGTFRHRPP